MAQQQASESVHLSAQFVDIAGGAEIVRDTNELV